MQRQRCRSKCVKAKTQKPAMSCCATTVIGGDLVKVEKIVEVGVCFGLADGCDLHEKKGLPRGWS